MAGLRRGPEARRPLAARLGGPPMTGWVVVYREEGQAPAFHSIKEAQQEARRVAAGLAGQATYAGKVVRVDVVQVDVPMPADAKLDPKPGNQPRS